MREHPKLRKTQLLEIALKFADKIGYLNVTRKMIAKKANMKPPIINTHFKTVANLKKELMREAIKRDMLNIIAQGLAFHDPIALKAADTIKQKALKHLWNFCLKA